GDERAGSEAGEVVGRAATSVPAHDGGTPHAGPSGSPEWGVPAGQRLTREEKKAQTRERLIKAAARVFAEKGFAATSLDEVAAGARTFKTDAARAALVFEIVGNGIALEKLIDPEGIPDDLFDRLMPVLIEAFEAGRL